MTAIRTILTAVDFSQTSYDALRLAADLARDLGAKLHVLHVATDPWQQPMLVEVPGTAFEALRQQCLATAKAQLASMLTECANRLPEVTSTVVMGAPALEIARYQEQHAIDLIVIGTHGQGPVRRFLLGSVADRVLRQASCPVLTVPARALRTQEPGASVEVSTAE